MKAFAVLVLALCMTGCGSSNEVTGPTSSAVPITGRVIDFFSRQEVRSTAIEFRTTAGTPVLTTNTDTAGQYSATLPRGGEYVIYMNGTLRGSAYVGDAGYRGDLMIDDGRCVARYGTVTDAAGRPLVNATLILGPLRAVSGNDGWYSMEFGCQSGAIGGNTIFINVTKDGYASWSRVVGRGIVGVERLDIPLGKASD